jgi:predicted RNase H-like HicB family nuclease
MGKVSFAARLSYCNEAVYVTFPDAPEAHTFGKTREEAIAMAKDAIKVWFSDGTPLPPATRFDETMRSPELYKDEHFEVYDPDDPEQGYELIEIVADIDSGERDEGEITNGHNTYEHPDGRRVEVPMHGGDMNLPMGTLNKIKKQAGY